MSNLLPSNTLLNCSLKQGAFPLPFAEYSNLGKIQMLSPGNQVSHAANNLMQSEKWKKEKDGEKVN